VLHYPVEWGAPQLTYDATGVPSIATMHQRRRSDMAQAETIHPRDLAARVEQLLHEGNVRRIIIRHDGHRVVEFPVTVGVVGALIAPVAAAAGALAAVLSNCTIEVERAEEASDLSIPADQDPPAVAAEASSA